MATSSLDFLPRLLVEMYAVWTKHHLKSVFPTYRSVHLNKERTLNAHALHQTSIRRRRRRRFRLHSHDIKWGSGSGQQSVTAVSAMDDPNSYWTIKPAHGEQCPQGTPVRHGQVPHPPTAPAPRPPLSAPPPPAAAASVPQPSIGGRC